MNFTMFIDWGSGILVGHSAASKSLMYRFNSLFSKSPTIFTFLFDFLCQKILCLPTFDAMWCTQIFTSVSLNGVSLSKRYLANLGQFGGVGGRPSA